MFGQLRAQCLGTTLRSCRPDRSNVQETPAATGEQMVGGEPSDRSGIEADRGNPRMQYISADINRRYAATGNPAGHLLGTLRIAESDRRHYSIDFAGPRWRSVIAREAIFRQSEATFANDDPAMLAAVE